MSQGRFVVGAPDNRLFAGTLSSHDADALGPDLVIRLTPESELFATAVIRPSVKANLGASNFS